MPRYVILAHDTRRERDRRSVRPSHWDLMLEQGRALQTWALASAPKRGRRVNARSLPDHRLMYLDYEGPISGDRGYVTRWDCGTYVVAERDIGWLKIVCRGHVHEGIVSFESVSPDGRQWVVRFT